MIIGAGSCSFPPTYRSRPNGFSPYVISTRGHLQRNPNLAGPDSAAAAARIALCLAISSSLDGRSTGENFPLGLIITDEDTGATKPKQGRSADETAAYGVHPACQEKREAQGLDRGRDAKIYGLAGGCDRWARWPSRFLYTMLPAMFSAGSLMLLDIVTV